MPGKFSDPKTKNLTDVELVQLSLENKEFFRHIILRYESKLSQYIKRMTNVNQEEFQDILQDIFIKVYRNLNGFNQNLQFSSWIYRIAHNEVINYYHKNKSRANIAKISLNNADILSLSGQITDSSDQYNQVALQENADKIREILAKLPNKYREVLVLRYLEEKKYDEISDILRKPPGTVATLINRGKSKFKKIAKYYDLVIKDA